MCNCELNNWIAKEKRKPGGTYGKETFKTYQFAMHRDYLDCDLNTYKNIYRYLRHRTGDTVNDNVIGYDYRW